MLLVVASSWVASTPYCTFTPVSVLWGFVGVVGVAEWGQDGRCALRGKWDSGERPAGDKRRCDRRRGIM
jgi:hypothetical protein